MDILELTPCLYVSFAILWSAYQGIRGAVEHHYASAKKDDKFYNWFVLYVHDFFFRFICTMAGFIALYVSYFLLTMAKFSELSSGTSALIVFSFVIGVIGVGGQLHHIILLGKLPKP
jgi:hypothetical protein